MYPNGSAKNDCEESRDMSYVTQLRVERLVMVSGKPFATVVSAIREGIGQPDMKALWNDIWSADSFEEIEAVVNPALGPTGLMQFGQFDDGGFIRKDRGDETPQAIRLLIGNPLIMKQMTEGVPDAAAYAPVTVLIDERDGEVHLSYDRMASLLSVYNNPEVTTIAKTLDNKIESLMQTAL
jgi:uncharacterized protein (DUF302 family)